MSAPVLSAAAAQQQRTEQLAGATADRARRYWGRIRPRSILTDWASIAPALFVLVANAQRNAALAADPYLERVAGAMGAASLPMGPVAADGFSGISSDGRPLGGALIAGPFQTLRSIGGGTDPAEALRVGAFALETVVISQVADAFRVATQVSMYMRAGDDPRVIRAPRGRLMVRDGDGRTRPYFKPNGYVRMVEPGACSRCIVLAGSRYSMDTAFDRHPRCKCTHIPSAENLPDVPETDPKEYFDGMSRDEQDRVFTKPGAEAIRLGADMNQIVNARRGMYSTRGGLKATRAGATRRGIYGSSQTAFTKDGGRYMVARAPRLMPEEIIRLSGGDRATAERLLKQYKFIL